MKERNAAGSGEARRLRVYARCTLLGEPARIVLDLEDRGVVSSVREAVVQGLLTLSRLFSIAAHFLKVN